MPVMLDTNCVLRYLLRDIEEQAQTVKETIISGAEVTVEVLAECVYVLESIYGLSRDTISDNLLGILGEVDCDRPRVAAQSLRYYSSSTNLAFVDCVLAAEAVVNGRDVLTFDKKLNSFIAREP